MEAEVFAQQSYRCRLEWGRRGAQAASARGDALVVVDTLSFSSAVVTAVEQGGLIYPCASQQEAELSAQMFGGEAAVPRQDVPEKGRFSLSPRTYLALAPGTCVALASPNGATCSRYESLKAPLFVGTLLNAAAVAAAVAHLLASTELCVTVLACGERWPTPSEDGALRFALEDYLGAGAILSGLPHTNRETQAKSPEARVCEAAFLSVREDLEAILWECGSGRELRARGYGDDVRHAAQWNRYQAVPRMIQNCLRSDCL